jgi:hypothetical protein
MPGLNDTMVGECRIQPAAPVAPNATIAAQTAVFNLNACSMFAEEEIF